ncbi:MAG TPA: hypothetical protein VFK56_10870 [Mycobacterium sp.]|nr:hypothetical protein [Mycobacterium sp.]
MTYANRDLAALWRQVKDAAEAQVALHDILPALIATYGAAAATLAADWYDELRDKVGVGGRFRAIPADIPDAGAHALVGWAATEAKDYSSFQTLIVGGMQRRIANFSRGTITGSAIADPKATGWQRTGSGECAFCSMLIARGAVYTEATADFASHDHCHCSAVPEFAGQPRPVQPYTPSIRNISDADRARVRDYLRTH